MVQWSSIFSLYYKIIRGSAGLSPGDTYLALDSLLDAFPFNAAIIRHDGTVIAVNSSWVLFSEQNEGVFERTGVGTNYLSVCELCGDVDGNSFANGIRSVLSESARSFQYLYPCHSPSEDRYFLGVVTAMEIEGETVALIVHQNVTDLMIAESSRNAESTLARLIVEHSPTPLLCIEASGAVLSANGAASTLLGYNKSALTQLSFDTLFPEYGESLSSTIEELEGLAGSVKSLERRTPLYTEEMKRIAVKLQIVGLEVGERTILVIHLTEDKEKSTGHGGMGNGHPKAAEKKERAILIVDDDEALIRLESTILSTLNYRILSAQNGVEGLSVFCSNFDDIDLVITDYNMPKLDGYGLANTIYSIAPKVPMVLISGNLDNERVRTLSNPNITFMNKPCSPMKLRDTVQKLLESSP